MLRDFGVDPGPAGYQQNVMAFQCLADFKRPEQMTDSQHVLAVKNDFHQKTPLDRKNPPVSEIPKIARDDCQHFVRGGLNRDSERIPRSLLRG